MTIASPVRPFRGIIPPLVTPLSARDRLDEAGLERLIEHVIAGGVNGIFVLGTTGEAPCLSYRLRCELIGRTCEIVDQRVPVLVGITDTSFVESVHLAQISAEAGATAVVLSAPFYFPLEQDELLRHISAMNEELPLPLMLYNMPGLTKTWFEIDTLRELSSIPNIVGIKDSGGDIKYFASLMTLRDRRPDWSILIGPEHLLAESLHMGGDGGVSGGANVLPQLFVACYRAAVAGDEEGVRRTNEWIQEFQRIYEVGKHASRFVRATKCALSLLDLCDDFMAEPFRRFPPPERDRVAAILAEMIPALRLALGNNSMSTAAFLRT